MFGCSHFIEMFSITCEIASRRAHILNTTSPSAVGDSLYSKSLIVYATRYVDIGTVTSNLSKTQSDLFALNFKIKNQIGAWRLLWMGKRKQNIWKQNGRIHWFWSDFWHITQCSEILVMSQADIKFGFHVRLIETWES